jgi:hypothetical protein
LPSLVQNVTPFLRTRGIRVCWAKQRTKHKESRLQITTLVAFVSSCMHEPVQPKNLNWYGKVGKFTNTPTPPLTCRLPQAAYVDIGVGCNRDESGTDIICQSATERGRHSDGKIVSESKHSISILIYTVFVSGYLSWISKILIW